MRVAIVGCGQIAQAHLRALEAIDGVHLVGACDRDRWRAEALVRQASSARAYAEFDELLTTERPDAVHVLTPPTSHAPLAIQAIEAGCHVLVEKPFALNAAEAEGMIASAGRHGVRLGTNHNYLFSPSIARARGMLDAGAIGDVVHVEGYYGVSEAGQSYTSVAGRAHWAWKLPGSAFTNLLPHLIYLQQAFLGEIEAVAGVTLSGGSPPTELVALVRGERGTGTMTISMRVRPYARYTRIYGTRAIVYADQATETLSVHPARQVPGMVAKVLYNLEDSAQLAAGTVANTVRVALRRLPSYAGLHYHVRAFYGALKAGEEVPVTGEDGRRMVQVLEMIWQRAADGDRRAEAAPADAPAHHASVAPATPGPRTEAERRLAAQGLGGAALVTGATGFLGYHLVGALRRAGVPVVALVRDRGRVPRELEEQATIVVGDLAAGDLAAGDLAAGDRRGAPALEAAMEGVAVVFHCAAITSNSASWALHEASNVQGTAAVLRAAQAAGVQRMVHVSSVAVYGLDDRARNGRLPESAPYADSTAAGTASALRWAHYMRSKTEADRLALAAHARGGPPVVVVRLGLLYGPGGREAARGLVQMGRFRFLMGSGRNHLPYTYVGNAVDALLLAALQPEALGKAINVIDEPQPRVREMARLAAQAAGEPLTLVPVPPFLLNGVARLLETRRARATSSPTPPKLSRYVVQSATRDLLYDTSRARELLGWAPEVSLTEGLRLTHAS